MKSAVERLLGRSVAPDEQISIVAMPPQRVPPAEDRAQAAKRLEGILGRRAEKVRDVPDDEMDAAMDDAAERVRHGKS